MKIQSAIPEASVSVDALSCVEDGVWTPIPQTPPGDEHRLHLKQVDENESHLIKERGVMTFHAVGCSGYSADLVPGRRVAEAMAAQVIEPDAYGGGSGAAPASFLFHLGDVVYRDKDQNDPLGKDQKSLYDSQFYSQYRAYNRSIFAVAGNHDGKSKGHPDKSPITHFLQNFCDQERRVSPDNGTDLRKAMSQPYPYWWLETPLAHIVGLYTNDANGGQLDDPMGEDQPQYKWLVRTFANIKEVADDKALLLALHYPPYSGAANFMERGNPNLGPSLRRRALEPLGKILQRAFRESGQYPDAVLSAHAHLYQRITYKHAGKRQIPYLIAGSGGHSPVENLFETCAKQQVNRQPPPLSLVLPPGLILPDGDAAQVVAYNDSDFGFVRLTVDRRAKTLCGEFFAIPPLPTAPAAVREDAFTLDLRGHVLR